MAGSGIGSFGERLLAVDPTGLQWSKFVHNDYLERFVDGGIPGLVMFMGFIVVVLVKGARIARTSLTPWALGLWAGLVTGAIHTALDHNWSEPGYAAVFMIVAGLLVTDEEATAP